MPKKRCGCLFILILMGSCLVVSISCSGQNEASHNFVLSPLLKGHEPSYQLFDSNGDGHFEIAISYIDKNANGNVSVRIYSANLSRNVDQINIPQLGDFKFQQDANETWFMGLAYALDGSTWYDEYDLQGNLKQRHHIINHKEVLGRRLNDDYKCSLFGYIDANDDATLDAVILLRAGLGQTPRGIVVIDRLTGHSIWELMLPALLDSNYGSIADLDGDGNQELLFSTSGSANMASTSQPRLPPPVPRVVTDEWHDYTSWLIALNRDGTLKWQRKMGGKFSNASPLALEDLDEDGELEVISVTRNHLEPRVERDGLYILDASTGAIERRILIKDSLREGMRLADTDNDSRSNIIVNTADGSILVFNEDLQEQLRVRKGMKTLLLGAQDINNDGLVEIVCQTDTDLTVFNNRLEMLARTDASNVKYIPDQKSVISPLKLRNPNGNGILITTDTYYLYSLNKNLAQQVYDILPVVTAVCLAVTVLATWAAYRERRRRRLTEQQVTALARGDGSTATLLLDADQRVLQTSTNLDDYCNVMETEHFHDPDHHLEDVLLASLRLLIDRMEKEEKSHSASEPVLLRRHERSLTVVIHLHALKSSHGVPRGYVAVFENCSVDAMAAIAAENIAIGQELMHKIKTLISVYRNDLYQLKSTCADGQRSETDEIIDEMNGVAEDISDISRRYLMLSRLDGSHFEEMDLNLLVREFERSWSLRSGIIKLELARYPLMFRGDREYLWDLLDNLVGNAVEASSTGQTVTVRTALCEEDPTKLLLEIEDSGEGIPEEYIDKVTEAGFTLKKQGAGMGLTISRRITELHGGRLEISSSSDGTTVRATLQRQEID